MRVRPKSNKENTRNFDLRLDYSHNKENLMVSVFEEYTFYYWIRTNQKGLQDIGCWRIKELKTMGKTGV